MSFVLAGAALRGPGPVPRAPGGAGNAGRCDTRSFALAGATQVSFVLAGAALRGPGPVPRAPGGAGNAGRRDTGVVCAGRRGT